MTDVGGFGSYLRQLRESKRLSLRQAAEAAQVSSGYLSQIEGGKREMAAIPDEAASTPEPPTAQPSRLCSPPGERVG